MNLKIPQEGSLKKKKINTWKLKLPENYIYLLHQVSLRNSVLKICHAAYRSHVSGFSFYYQNNHWEACDYEKVW